MLPRRRRHIKHLPVDQLRTYAFRQRLDIFHCVHLFLCQCHILLYYLFLSHVHGHCVPLLFPVCLNISIPNTRVHVQFFLCNKLFRLPKSQTKTSLPASKTLISKNGFPGETPRISRRRTLPNQFPPPSPRGNLILSRCPIYDNRISSQLNSHYLKQKKRSVSPTPWYSNTLLPLPRSAFFFILSCN